MPPIWNSNYYGSLSTRFKGITAGLKDRLQGVVDGRVTPSPENIPIGSGRNLDSAVMFFDIRESSKRSGYVALYTLDTVIPMVMKIVHDHDGYIEKNTGDGVMAIITGMDEKKACKQLSRSL